MGSPQRKKKDYVMRGSTVSKAVENEPPGYCFKVSGKLLDFEQFKQFDDKSKDIAWGLQWPYGADGMICLRLQQPFT